MHRPCIKRQCGVAVVTALLLTTLAVTIVASMFWQQQVQIRSIENQQTQSQKQWLLRGLLDWAMLLLREDIGNSGADHLSEAWAAPMQTDRLDQFLGIKDADAYLAGRIVDAQSRYNLRNLAFQGEVHAREVAVFGRLLLALGLNPNLAQRCADAMAAAADPHRLPIEQLDDLLAVSGMNQALLDRLREHVVILPNPTPVNINTASALVLSARLEVLSKDDISRLIAGRERAHIRDAGDLRLRLQGKPLPPLERELSYSSNYFLFNGKVRVRHGTLEMQALMERSFMTGSRVLWIRE
ncbi:MAG: type II secretion system minor pseudopilin GspK [Burkholderiales bacterium]|nr:type II secretion system minor pseudopilin GspK [Burkholderiales bacterium]